MIWHQVQCLSKGVINALRNAIEMKDEKFFERVVKGLRIQNKDFILPGIIRFSKLSNLDGP